MRVILKMNAAWYVLTVVGVIPVAARYMYATGSVVVSGVFLGATLWILWNAWRMWAVGRFDASVYVLNIGISLFLLSPELFGPILIEGLEYRDVLFRLDYGYFGRVLVSGGLLVFCVMATFAKCTGVRR